jgi:hypothetical protein
MRNQTRSKTRLTAKSNSRQVRNVGSSRNVLGIRQARPHSELLGTEAIRARQVEAVAKQHDRFLGKLSCVFVLFKYQIEWYQISPEMTPAEQTAFHEMRELPKEQDSDDWIMLDDVLDGSIPLDISHEGGELDGLRDEFRKTYALFLC